MPRVSSPCLSESAACKFKRVSHPYRSLFDLINIMWISKQEYLRQDEEIKYLVATNEGHSLNFGQAISLWRTDADFRQFFIDLLAIVPFVAYRWECPPVTIKTLDQQFEFVVTEDRFLENRQPYIEAFRYYFEKSPAQTVVEFHNLRKDAILIVPSPIQTKLTVDYSHLAGFCRTAPEQQQQDFWQKVGMVMELRKSDRPVWLSTAGGGVPWLHVRLDDRPKYYRHREYRLPGV